MDEKRIRFQNPLEKSLQDKMPIEEDDHETNNQRKTIREKKNLNMIPKREIIRVETSPATQKLNKLNRLIRELFQ